jgi:hypothetical protein
VEEKLKKRELNLDLKTVRFVRIRGADVPRPKGRMVYSHKTGAEIEILSAESWEENKKYFTPNGARSALKNFSRNICS